MSARARVTRALRAVVPTRRLLVLTLLAMLAGAVVGTVVAFATPAHVEIAGSDTRVWVRPGRTYDQFGVQGVVSLERPTPRALIGEPLGIQAVLDLDVSQLVDSRGQFDADVLPAYIQAYSDPAQLVSDIRTALLVHLIVFAATGAGVALLLVVAVVRYRRWRVAYDEREFPRDAERARTYRRPEQSFARRLAVGLVVVAVLGAVPSGAPRPPPQHHLRADDLFNGTPLEGARVDGLLRPALLAAQDYVRKYFGDTDDYYNRLEDQLNAQLDQAPVLLPTGPDLAEVGFVTDRHCNTGMDRVVVDLLKRYDVRTLVSGGDDAFSGSFGFEAACTRGLAERSRRAGVTDVFVGGNHDSAQTLEFEREQGIKTLTGNVVTAGGLRFVGTPDPRTSRYGQGIEPSSAAAQQALVDAQGRAVGRTACTETGPLIAVLHDPRAGAAAIDNGCGNVTLALDGHTHVEHGPTAHPLPSGRVAYAFTGATAGGAPTENSIERTFASRLTVGPLNHDATVYILTVDRRTGALTAVTSFRFTPDQDVTVSQQLVP